MMASWWRHTVIVLPNFGRAKAPLDDLVPVFSSVCSKAFLLNVIFDVRTIWNLGLDNDHCIFGSLNGEHFSMDLKIQSLWLVYQTQQYCHCLEPSQMGQSIRAKLHWVAVDSDILCRWCVPLAFPKLPPKRKSQAFVYHGKGLNLAPPYHIQFAWAHSKGWRVPIC